MGKGDLQTLVQTDLEALCESMNVQADVNCEIQEGDDKKRVVSITFEGDNLGYLIGNHGNHLRSLQFILGMLINKKYSMDPEDHIYVNVDVSGYKKDRYEKIEQIAMRMADDARILGEPVDMDPMPAAERRVVHVVLSQFDDITTESFGDGPDRYVRIIPKSEKELGVVKEPSGVSDVAEEEEESEAEE